MLISDWSSDVCSSDLLSRPSDLIPELQGRFPIRVELDSLTAQDFVRILCDTDASLTKQYKALLGTEDVVLDFTDEGIQRLAELAFDVNERTEHIGARRQNGRASCRERVCRYVSISVVAATLKKKKENK